MGSMIKRFGAYSSEKRLAGMFITRPESGFKFYKPNYKKGPTLFRAWGDVTESGRPVCWWDEDNKDYNMGFMTRMPMATRWGDEFQFTCIGPIKDPENWNGSSPVELFYDVVYTSKNPAIQALRKPSPTSSYDISIVTPISAVTLLKGVLFENAGKPYYERPLWRVLLGLTSSATTALTALLQSKRQDPTFDPIAYDTGCVFEFDKEDNLAPKKAVQFNVKDDPQVAAAATTKSPIDSYGCRIYPDNPVVALDADRIGRMDRKFEDILWFMTGEEQLTRCILPAFGDRYREAVLQAFQNTGALPESYLSGKRVVQMPEQTPARGPVQSVPEQRPAVSPAAARAKLSADGPEGTAEEEGEETQTETAEVGPTSADEIRARFRKGNG